MAMARPVIQFAGTKDWFPKSGNIAVGCVVEVDYSVGNGEGVERGIGDEIEDGGCCGSGVDSSDVVGDAFEVHRLAVAVLRWE